jgi:hypothetical protein
MENVLLNQENVRNFSEGSANILNQAMTNKTKL